MMMINNIDDKNIINLVDKLTNEINDLKNIVITMQKKSKSSKKVINTINTNSNNNINNKIVNITINSFGKENIDLIKDNPNLLKKYIDNVCAHDNIFLGSVRQVKKALLFCLPTHQLLILRILSYLKFLKLAD